MSHIPSFKLNNGISIPAIGLGCWSGLTKEQQDVGKEWMLTALKHGYRHLDTAHGYGTEPAVGMAIRESGIPREEIFVTTKLPSHHHGRVPESLNESLERFGYDYFDLYLMHWPQAFVYRGVRLTQSDYGPTSSNNDPDDDPSPLTEDGNYAVVENPNFNETWANMEKLLESGKVKAIGVSNFSVKTLTKLLETAKIVPAINQVETHPHLNQNALKAFCDSKGIILTAYSPTGGNQSPILLKAAQPRGLGYAPVRNDPSVISVAKKHNVSPTQVVLAWHISRGIVAVPKSTSSEHQLQNLNLPKIDDLDIATLGSLNKETHLCGYPGHLCGYPEPKYKVFGWSYEQLGWEGTHV